MTDLAVVPQPGDDRAHLRASSYSKGALKTHWKSDDRARLRAVLQRLGPQETDPGVWDDLAAENAALAPARARATRALLDDGDPPAVTLGHPKETTVKPYTRADVEMVERAIQDVTPPIRDGYVDGRDLLTAEASAALEALAAAGRLMPPEPVNDIEATHQPDDPHARRVRRVRRVWTYRRDEWDPAWRHKLGVPYRGGDEWGRRTVVVGLWLVGYVVLAWRTCWCPDCHEVREQTYRLREIDIDA